MAGRGQSPQPARLVAGTAGAGHVLYGSDAPPLTSLKPRAIRLVEDLKLPERGAVFWRNAASLLKLPVEGAAKAARLRSVSDEAERLGRMGKGARRSARSGGQDRARSVPTRRRHDTRFCPPNEAAPNLPGPTQRNLT